MHPSWVLGARCALASTMVKLRTGVDLEHSNSLAIMLFGDRRRGPWLELRVCASNPVAPFSAVPSRPPLPPQPPTPPRRHGVAAACPCLAHWLVCKAV